MSNAPNTHRRVRSAAAARRMQVSLTIPTSVVPELPTALMSVVAGFKPKPPLAHDWATLQGVVAQAITRASIRGPESVRKHLTHLGYFYAWARQQDLPMVTATLIRAHVDEYTRCGMPDSSEKSRADRRARLRSVADQVNPHQRLDTGVPIPRPSIRPPYTAQELQRLIRVALTQPTPALTRKAALCIGLGAGAGLDSRDFRGLRRKHVTDAPTGGLVVEFPDNPSKTVPVRKELEHLVALGIADLEPEQLLLGRAEQGRNLAARALEDVVVLGEGPRIEQARLRATWLAVLLRQPVPLDVVMQAAGLRTARTLPDLFAYLQPLDPDRVAAILRGPEVTA